MESWNKTLFSKAQNGILAHNLVWTECKVARVHCEIGDISRLGADLNLTSFNYKCCNSSNRFRYQIQFIQIEKVWNFWSIKLWTTNRHHASCGLLYFAVLLRTEHVVDNKSGVCFYISRESSSIFKQARASVRLPTFKRTFPSNLTLAWHEVDDPVNEQLSPGIIRTVTV